MPLNSIQKKALKVLARRRNPDSYVAGGLPINLAAERFSRDIDIFHANDARIAEIAEGDAAALESAGFTVKWIRRDAYIQSATIEWRGEKTRLEWVVDSDYRFFPVIPDEVFGYVLHPVDLATNKVMAAAGRREVRDIVDAVTIHRSVLPLGAAVWAGVDKAPGLTPEGAIAEIRRNSNYPREEWRRIVSTEPIDPLRVYAELRKALDEAEAFVLRMPTEVAGLLFLLDGKVVQPDPDHLDRYQTHAGKRLGHWPRSPEIESAMLERYTSGRSTA